MTRACEWTHNPATGEVWVGRYPDRVTRHFVDHVARSVVPQARYVRVVKSPDGYPNEYEVRYYRIPK